MAQVFKHVQVTVAPASNARLITWRLHPDYIPTAVSLSFYVEIGQSAGSWTRINPDAPVVDDNIYTDSGAYLRDPRDILYYRVVMDDNGVEYASVPAGVHGELSRRERNLAKEILRRHYLTLEKNTGTYGYLLRKREWGTPCTCADPDLGLAASDSCPVCLGTGIIQGYYPACPYWLSIEPGPIQKQETGTVGVKIEQTCSAIGISYPMVSQDDVWVDSKTGDRYIIDGAITPAVMLRSTPLVLLLPMRKLPSTDAVYQISVDESGADGWTTNIATF